MSRQRRVYVLFFSLFNIAVLFGLGENYGNVNTECGSSKDKKAIKLYKEAENKFKTKDYRGAIYLLNRALEMEEDYGDALFLLGYAYISKGDKNLLAAEKYLSRAISVCPDKYPYAYYYIGEIQFWDERYVESIKNLEKFISFPESEIKNKDYDRADKMLSRARFYDKIFSNPVPFNPKLLKNISTNFDEYLPIISPDGEISFFTRRKQIAPDEYSIVQRGVPYIEKFCMSNFVNDSVFEEGEPLPDPFNKSQNEGGATVTIDNKYLFYTICNFTAKGYYNCDIYIAENVNGKWGNIKNMGEAINTDTTWEAQPSISGDGNVLYFVSDRADGIGGYDIYYSNRLSDGTWSKAINIGKEINTVGNEKSPFIHPDSKTLYFASDGWETIGGYDIFFSRRDSAGRWSKPQNIGYPINSREDDISFFVSTNGKKAYFASNKLKGAGGWDVYYFDLYKEAQPDKILFIKGYVKDESDSIVPQVEVELKSLKSKEVKKISVDSVTGKYATIVSFNDDYILTVKQEDKLPEVKYFAREDSTLCEKTNTVNFNIQDIKTNVSFKINDIYFATASYELNNQSKAVIDEFVEFLKNNPNINIAIYGHTDDVGSDSLNYILSENRAKTIYEYLVERGIAKERLTYRGFGKNKPVVPNISDENRARNRRTEFVITKQ